MQGKLQNANEEIKKLKVIYCKRYKKFKIHPICLFKHNGHCKLI